MRNWQIMKFVSAVGTAFVALHGATTRKWRRWHTAFVVLGAVATIGVAVEERRSGAGSGSDEEGSTPRAAPSAVA
jgi:hypothetical protein